MNIHQVANRDVSLFMAERAVAELMQVQVRATSVGLGLLRVCFFILHFYCTYSVSLWYSLSWPQCLRKNKHSSKTYSLCCTAKFKYYVKPWKANVLAWLCCFLKHYIGYFGNYLKSGKWYLLLILHSYECKSPHSCTSPCSCLWINTLRWLVHPNSGRRASTCCCNAHKSLKSYESTQL